jgi:ATP-dependent Clp protease ATP-binding subunit ClpC
MTDPRHIDVRTWLVVRELDGGESLVAPAADPSLASFGDEADALDEQRVFLAEYFARVPPERVAGFDLPEGVSLQRVTVSLTREDLPRALAAPIDVAVPLLRIPAQGHGWAMVLPLGHTIYLERDELASPRFEEVVRAEVRRLVSARQPTPLEWLRLLPGAAERLEPIEVAFEAAALADGRTAALRRAIVEREQRKRWGEVLAAVADVIHASAERPLIARDTELGTLTALLTGTARVPVALVGEAGVGKSALVRAFVASRERSRPALVYATSGAQLVSGMSGFGQWQERLRRTLEAAAGLDAILWFDDLAELVADRPPPGGEGGIDLAGAMKPWLDEGKVRVIGELREERAADLAQRHVGFSSTFTRVRVPALPPIDAERALAAVAAHVAKRGGTGLAPAATSALVALADRYLPYEAFPGKAIALYDELRAARAASPGAPTMGAQHADIDADEVFAAFARRSGVPAFLLREAQAVRLDELIDALGRRVVGQREAVRRVAETVCVVKASMQPRGKPLATFLFVGPTGVGKTELARALAEVLFGASGEDRLLRFDMSEYMDALAGERLIRGSERPGEPSSGVLVREVREQPFSVVLLDEIEKAHPSVFDLLLQVCGEGRLTDVRGRTAYFHNAIIILTSNLGAAAKRPLAGFGGRTTSDADHYLAHVEATFRPELVNRLDRVIPFSALEREEIRAIARKVVRGVSTRRGLAEPGVALDVSEGALDVLADGGFHAAYGARALRRHLERALVDPVAHALAARAAEIRAARVSVRATSEPPAQTAEGRTIALVSPGLVIAIELAGAQQRRELRGIDAVPGVRRELSRLAHDERVERVREQVAFLVAQLGKRPSRRGRDDAPQARLLGELNAEHHRLSRVLDEVDATLREAHALEELAMPAFFAGEELESSAGEVGALRARGRAAVLRAVLAMMRERDEITLLLQELDDRAGFAPWLAPLLRDLPHRGWEAALHVHGEKTEPGVAWPAARAFGPPIDAIAFLARLDDPSRSFRNVLLRVRGPDAASLLVLEGGLVRSERELGDDGRADLYVHRIARRWALTDEEWIGRALLPPPPTAFPELRREAPRRTLSLHEREVRLPGRVVLSIDPRDYWTRHAEIAFQELIVAGAGAARFALDGVASDDDDDERGAGGRPGKGAR